MVVDAQLRALSLSTKQEVQSASCQVLEGVLMYVDKRDAGEILLPGVWGCPPIS
jgi:hypothetical protein